MTGGPALEPRHPTLVDALAAASRSSLGLTFVDAAERETFLPFHELRRRARAVAATLAAQGVQPGDRVALVLPTCPAFVETFFGALLAGAVPVPLYPPVRLGRLDEYHRRTAAMLAAVRPALVVSDDRVRRLLGLAVARAGPGLRCVTAASLVGRGELELPASPGDLALVQFSSGTTVDAKPVALTHANLTANLAAIDAALRPDGEPQVGVSWLPLYHDMGLIGCLLSAVYQPGHVVLLPPDVFLARPHTWLRAISRHRATVSPAPNFAYGLCLKRVREGQLTGVDLSSWRFALDGAEPVTAGILRRFLDTFAPYGLRPDALVPVYGLSEATLAVTFGGGGPFRSAGVDALALARDGVVRDGAREVVSVGAPLAGVELEVRDGAGRPLDDDLVGRLFVRGPSVMAGYYGRPEATANALDGGWLDTGDLAFTRGGELFVCGRAKDVVVLRGANHAPQEFEECVEGLSGVRAGCMVAFGDVADEAGEELVLLVETEDGAPPGLADELRGRVAAATGIRPRTVELLAKGTLPRTSSGKLRRAEAARQWRCAELTAPAPVTAARLSFEVVRSELYRWRSRLRG